MSTRIYASINAASGEMWFEISRAQSHGFAVNCAVFTAENCIASCAEEKIIRLFVAPTWLLEDYEAAINCESGIYKSDLCKFKKRTRMVRQSLGLSMIKCEAVNGEI